MIIPALPSYRPLGPWQSEERRRPGSSSSSNAVAGLACWRRCSGWARPRPRFTFDASCWPRRATPLGEGTAAAGFAWPSWSSAGAAFTPGCPDAHTQRRRRARSCWPGLLLKTGAYGLFPVPAAALPRGLMVAGALRHGAGGLRRRLWRDPGCGQFDAKAADRLHLHRAYEHRFDGRLRPRVQFARWRVRAVEMVAHGLLLLGAVPDDRRAASSAPAPATCESWAAMQKTAPAPSPPPLPCSLPGATPCPAPQFPRRGAVITACSRL